MLGSLLAVAVALLAAVPWADDLVPARPAGTKTLAETMELEGARIVETRWTPIARIDVVEADDSVHPFLPGLVRRRDQSRNGRRGRADLHLPPAGRARRRRAAELVELTNYELAMLLRPAGDVLVIGPGGGHEIYVATRWTRRPSPGSS